MKWGKATASSQVVPSFLVSVQTLR